MIARVNIRSDITGHSQKKAMADLFPLSQKIHKTLFHVDASLRPMQPENDALLAFINRSQNP